MSKENKEESKKVEIIAARRFADKETGQIYETGADLSSLSEKRIAEIKARGFIKE